ncbi:cytochrome P450 [Parahaliea sp. F7430]|uniref:Cytochrome P450 n=1 Tax=Sediminihaliea albiluteola TaxID=2758564 RepID=A0A7W2YKD4_9GAMM|nr:cytochrome P450 [Sediminihaliea albiluteola]MBA6414022.1 cytochrome P450 [Sediminihaliea albiluteola]
MNRNLELLNPAIMGDEQAMYELFRYLREHDPVSYVEHHNYEPFWAITRYEDIKFISQNNDRFINSPRTVLVQKQFEQVLLENFGSRNGLETLIHMDAPKHKKLRGVTREWFKPGPISKLSSTVKSIAKQYVDKMEARGGECDFVKEISLLYPLQVIMSIIGVPPEKEGMMLKLTQELFGGADPSQARGVNPEDALAVLMDFFAFFSEVVEDRKKNPKDDLATVLASALIDGEPMEQLDQISYFIITATAGHDTTAATVAGGLKALIEHPDQLQKLRDKPELCHSAAREMIRYTSPVRHMMRTTTQDEVFQGQTIKAGESICLWYPSANRDSTAITNPDVFDIERDNKSQLAFGFGSHMCLGQHLAILEVELFFRELLPRLKHIEFASEPEWVQAIFVGGLKSMPLRYEFN